MAEKASPRPAAAYAALYPHLCEVVRPLGYALLIHGSMARDFDLVAVPWSENAVEPEAVVEAVCERVYGYTEWDTNPGKLRPHGRRSWLIWLRGAHGIPVGDTYIDLSIMPRINSIPADPAAEGRTP